MDLHNVQHLLLLDTRYIFSSPPCSHLASLEMTSLVLELMVVETPQVVMTPRTFLPLDGLVWYSGYSNDRG